MLPRPKNFRSAVSKIILMHENAVSVYIT